MRQAGAAVTFRAFARSAPAALDAVQCVGELLTTRRFRHVLARTHWRVLRTSCLSVRLASMLIAERSSAPVELAGCPCGVSAAVTGAEIATADKQRNGCGLGVVHGFVFPVLMIHDHRRECAYGCGTKLFGR